MDKSQNMPMSMSMMPAAFYASTSTPLFSSAWTPHTTGAYAGTCIFLILLAACFRGLVALKHFLKHRQHDKDLNRRYVTVRGIPTEAEQIKVDSDSKDATLITARGVEEHVRVVQKTQRVVRPWRFSVDLPQAAYATIVAGVMYLLMVAVMTLNVGYFLSVLGGIFLGELVFGRYN